jgi:uncharacterized membrane protein
LIIAPVVVGCGAGNVNDVISKLNALRNEVLKLPDCAFEKPCHGSCYRRVLAHKIEVVTHMVEVGAYNGAIHKLENDVKKLVKHWVIEDYSKRLIEKIDEIINLLKKLKPPCPPHFPDFAVTAFPDFLTVEQGGTNSSTIMVNSLNGFKKPVDLTVVTSSPISGIVISLDPPQVTPPKDDYVSSTLTVEAAENASIGVYTITVTATGGCLKHSVEILLKITPSPPPQPAFDFSVTANPLSLKVQQGGSNVSVIVITSLTAASQPVNLAVTSTPINGVRAVLNPLQVIPPSNNSAISLLTVETDITAPLGDNTITVTGTTGVLKRSVNITLKVMAPPVQPTPDFIIAAFPSSISIQAGASGTLTIVIISVRDFSQSVSITATCEPSQGITLSLNPLDLTPEPNNFKTSILTIEVNSAASLGEYKITVAGISGSLTHNVIIPLTVTGPPLPPFPDFSVAAFPTSLEVKQGEQDAASIIVTSLKGFSQPVSLEATSVAGVNLAFNPLQITPPPNGVAASILTVYVDVTVAPDEYSITVTGTSGSLQHNVNIALKVVAAPVPPIPDFKVAAFPSSLSIQAGDSCTSTIVVLSLSGFDQSVNLMAACEPSKGVTLSLNPTTVVSQPNDFATSTLTVKVDSTAALGAYKITVTGTSGGLIHSVDISLTVTGPPLPPFSDFSLTVSPSSLRVQQGGFGASSIIVTSLRGFSQPVSLTVTSVIGVNLALQPLQVTPPPNSAASSMLTVSIYAVALPGTYGITVTGTSGDLKHDANILLEVTAEKEPPQIASVLRLPENPAYNDSVTVLALVTDVGSGVRSVVLSYFNGVDWADATMTLKEGLYSASIPAFAYSTAVKYRVDAYDFAGNQATSDLDAYTVSDPYSPVIGDPSWMPEEPDANVDITFKVTVTEPTGSSGVRNATLWFKSKTLDWTAVPMTFANGTWTAKLSNQSDTSIDFKITAYDYAGNSAETKLYQFQVKALTGLPLSLSLILLVIIILAILTGSAIYLLWRRRQLRKTAGGAPKPAPPSPPSAARKLAAPIKGYEMVSFVVPARNEESTISQRIARAYERAADHVGPSEIIVVDDGSVDGTYEAAWSAIASNRKKWPNIPAKVVKLSSTLGKEEAVRFGRNKATGEIVETVNGDTSKILSSIVPIGIPIYV